MTKRSEVGRIDRGSAGREPRALRPGPEHAGACPADPLTGRCVTCADEGIEGTIVVLRADALAEVEMGGRTREVAIELIDGARVGDRVLVHAGVAIAKLDS